MDLKGLPTDREWTEAEWKLALAKAKRELEKQKAEKRKAKRETFDMLFPELQGMPIVWIIIALACVAFNLLAMVV